MSNERNKLAQLMQQYGHPVFDRFSVGRSCRQRQREGPEPWPPCLRDGMHSHRFLDRMRAQMLLNWRCPTIEKRQ